jgi:hypothetical protein
LPENSNFVGHHTTPTPHNEALVEQLGLPAQEGSSGAEFCYPSNDRFGSFASF